MEGEYRHGEKHGQWIYRSIEGALVKEETYDNGRREGLWQEWNAKDIKSFEGRYLAGRIRSLDHIFSPPSLIHAHRWNSYILSTLALLHPICILASDGIYMVPLEVKFWPEWVGVALLALILLQVSAARWRQTLLPRCEKWRLWHKNMGVNVLITIEATR